MSFFTALGSLIGFTNLQATAVPNDVIPVSYFKGSSTTATVVDVAIIPKGTSLNNRGAILGQIPDNTAAGGNKRGSSAVDLQTDRTAAAAVASGVASFNGGGTDNTSSGAQSSNIGGSQNTASGLHATVTGGFKNTADGGYCRVGGRTGLARGVSFIDVWGGGSTNVDGDVQSSRLLVKNNTADATPTVLTSGGGGAGVSNINVMPNNGLFTFVAYVNGIKNGFGDFAGFKIEGTISRGAGAATTALVGAPVVTALGASAGAAAWAVAAAADAVNGGLTIVVTGAAATSIKWVGRVDCVENAF